MRLRLLLRLLPWLAAAGLPAFPHLAWAQAADAPVAIERLLEVARLTAEDTRSSRDNRAARLDGSYVALDRTITEPLATASCDDDGDAMVVLSTRFVEDVRAVGAVIDGARDDRARRSLVLALGEPRGRSRGSLVPPIGSFEPRRSDPTPPAEGDAARRRAATSIVAAIVFRELRRIAHGRLPCGRGSAARELADQDVSPRERRRAREWSRRLDDPERDAELDPAVARWMSDNGLDVGAYGYWLVYRASSSRDAERRTWLFRRGWRLVDAAERATARSQSKPGRGPGVDPSREYKHAKPERREPSENFGGR